MHDSANGGRPRDRPPPGLHDRRLNRLTVPACGTCGSVRVRVVSRTDYVVYVRCDDCSGVWSLAKPGRQGSE